MRHYALTLLFSPLLTEQEVNDAMQDMSSFVQEKGAILGEQEVKGKRPLASSLNGQSEAYLARINFTLAPEYLAELEKKCKENTSIMRFLPVQQKKKTARVHQTPVLAASGKKASTEKESTSATLANQAQEEQATEQKRAGSGANGEEKVDLKDIDEKLEEIFKESS